MLTHRIHTFTEEITQKYQRLFLPILEQKEKIVERHQENRTLLAEKHSKRQQQETKQRQARLKKGIRSVWDHLTGKHGQVQKLNEIDAYQCHLRDQTEKDTMIFHQLEERSRLQDGFETLKLAQQEEVNKLKNALFSKLPEEKITQLRQEFDHIQLKNCHSHGRDLSL